MTDLVPTENTLAARREAMERRHFRSEVLDRLRSGVLALDDQVTALAKAGDLDGLAEGGQDLQALVGDLHTVMDTVRFELGRLVDERVDAEKEAENERRLADWQERVDAAEAKGRKPPKPPALLKVKPTGIKRATVEGVGVIECNGERTRSDWRSVDLLRHLFEQVIDASDERIVTPDGEVVDPKDSAIVADLLTMLETVMPVTASLNWRTGRVDPDGTVTGLRAYGIDSEDWCEIEVKPRKARVPKMDGAVT